jgi:hypothetical protein
MVWPGQAGCCLKRWGQQERAASTCMWCGSQGGGRVQQCGDMRCSGAASAYKLLLTSGHHVSDTHHVSFRSQLLSMLFHLDLVAAIAVPLRQ